MSCCKDDKNLTLYRAETPTGAATACKKCGRAHPATRAEIDRIGAIIGGYAEGAA